MKSGVNPSFPSSRSIELTIRPSGLKTLLVIAFIVITTLRERLIILRRCLRLLFFSEKCNSIQLRRQSRCIKCSLQFGLNLHMERQNKTYWLLLQQIYAETICLLLVTEFTIRDSHDLCVVRKLGRKQKPTFWSPADGSTANLPTWLCISLPIWNYSSKH